MLDKPLLLIFRQSPYGSCRAKEMIDLALTVAAYDLPLHILFMGDGVWQLLKGQDGKAIQQKSPSAMLGAFPIYGIDNIYVSESALQGRNLRLDQLELSVTVIKDQQLSQFIDQHSAVLNG